MIRDYINHEIERILPQMEALGREERIIDEARGPANRERRGDAENKAKGIRGRLLTDTPSAAIHEFLDATKIAKAVNFRTEWQAKNRQPSDMLREITRHWREGAGYYRDLFESPQLNVHILPTYSFVIKFTFTLAQPYLSKDEQTFYIIDNPIRTDKVFGLPFVASSTWKGSLRAALWQLGYKDTNESIRHLFGNEKTLEEDEGNIQAQAQFRAGRLYFYPAFFTTKSLEVINPQDRELRVGKIPVAFESVPQGAKGVFTLLYVPYDLVGEEEATKRQQFANGLTLVVQGLQAMFRAYGFGAKTSSGFGLAEELVSGDLTVHDTSSSTKSFDKFGQLTEVVHDLVMEINRGKQALEDKVEHES